MAHRFVVSGQDETTATFFCKNCGRAFGFVKEGMGEPSVKRDKAGDFQPPDNISDWLGECVDA